MENIIILGIVGTTEVIVGLILLIAFVFAIRLIGAWMLRINEIIEMQKQIINALQEIHKELKNNKG